MSSFSFGDGILPPMKRKPASTPPASEMAQSSIAPAPLAGPMASQHVAVLEGVDHEQQLGTVINLAQKREQKAAPKSARIDSAFKEVKASLPPMSPAGSSSGPRLGPTGVQQVYEQSQTGGGAPPCMSVCDLVYVIEAAKRSRSVTVNWQTIGGKARGLGAQQVACQLITLNADQVKAFAPRAQQFLDAMRPSGQDVAECIARYCKDYGCPVETKTATIEQVCQLVFAIKAAQYGRPFSMDVNGSNATLSAEQMKEQGPRIAATLKAMLDKGLTTSDVVAACEKKYCEQYGCAAPATGAGGGTPYKERANCPEGTSFDMASAECVPNEAPVAKVDTGKKGFGWLAAAGIAAVFAKKVLFVSALAGAPKLVELEDEE